MSTTSISHTPYELTPAQLKKILVLWLLFTSGNSVEAIAQQWNTKIRPRIGDLVDPDSFLTSAKGSKSSFQDVIGTYSAYVNPIWGGSGICPTPSVDLIAQLF